MHINLPILLWTTGVILFVISGLIRFLPSQHSSIKDTLSEQYDLMNNPEAFQKWKANPNPRLATFHIFNITNPSEILSGGKPAVRSIGHYVFEHFVNNTNAIHPENDTISYQPVNNYYFRRDKSSGDLNERITVPNIPFIAFLAKGMAFREWSRNTIFEALNDLHPEEPVFLNLSVDEFLFKGYHVDFMYSMANLLGQELIPNHTYGAFYNRNGTTGDPISVYADYKNPTTLGKVATFNGTSHLDLWNDRFCNMLNGSLSTLYPPRITRDHKLSIFDDIVKRSFTFEYDYDSVTSGIPGYRFTISNTNLQEPKTFPDNSCYCWVSDDNCPRSGVFQLRKFSPIYRSLPHFLDADIEYLNGIEGLMPNRSQHESFITLEPTSGVLLEAKTRIQSNIMIKSNGDFPQLKRVRRVLLPIMWFEESIMITRQEAEELKRSLRKQGSQIGEILSWVMFATGVASIILGIGIIFIQRFRQKNCTTTQSNYNLVMFDSNEPE